MVFLSVLFSYAYWVVVGDHLAQVPLSVLQTATTTTVLSSQIIMLPAGMGAIRFTLDLNNLTYFVVTASRITIDNLTNNTQITQVSSPVTVGSSITSYLSTMYFILRGGNQWTVAGFPLPSTLPITSRLFLTELFAIRMFRRSFQPLPGKDLLYLYLFYSFV